MVGENATFTGILGEGRLDSALAAALPQFSRARIQALIADAALRINGQSFADPASKKMSGQHFELHVPAPKPDKAIPQDIQLEVVYEDDHLIIVNKPAGLVVHPAAGHSDGTLVNALLHHCQGKLSGIGGVQRPGIVHRIDKDTSGLLVVAKSDVAHEGLAKLFAAQMEKTAPGKLKIQIYPSEQLGSIPRMVEGMGMGTVEAWVGPPEFMVGIEPRMQVFGAPGLVFDMEHGYRLTQDERFRQASFSWPEAKGIKGLGLVVYGPNGYTSKKALRTLADWKGQKLRVFGSPMHTVAMEKLGATGVPMNPADALGVKSSALSLRSLRLMHIQKAPQEANKFTDLPHHRSQTRIVLPRNDRTLWVAWRGMELVNSFRQRESWSAFCN